MSSADEESSAAALRLALPGSLATLMLAVVLAVASAQGGAGSEPAGPEEAVPVSGSEVYERRCSVCHGETGAGLEEARLAFPEEHRRCERCHRPSNPPQMSLAQVETRQNNLFAIGEAPPLVGSGALASHAEADALRSYIAATMPRYNPSALTADEYDAVTAYLLELNGR